ncbi:MAG: NADP-dependent phosphogluconate dehydrogenase [Deltaproteobacteria bacterium]|nr:NADP-dependent phosphogluconate dehydrogenase [Deltaproteobacteria bacterium]
MSEQIGLVGLAVMGQNLALNIAEEGFRIAVYNRSPDKVDETVARAQREGALPLVGYKDVGAFVKALERPRRIILLVKAGAPVDATLDSLVPHLEPGDIVIDGGNEYFVNTERRARALAEKGLRFFGMGVSGGEEGARHGPSLMPGGDPEGYEVLAPVLTKVAAQVDDGPCVTYIGPGGAGHYVKMVHNGIEYGDMQLIAEAYDVLKHVGGLSNPELAQTFSAWNEGDLQSFLIEITAKVLRRSDPEGAFPQLVDAIMDVSGMKGTGKWTVQQAAELASAAPTIASAVEARIMSAARGERLAASKVLQGPAVSALPAGERQGLVDDVRSALYAAKICSYAQGMNLLRTASNANNWGLKLGAISRIWKGGCIIRARFLDRIRAAYDRDPGLASLLVDPDFAAELNARQAAWRRVVVRAVEAGIAVPGMTASLGYYDTYRRARLPANLIQAQRDFFGAHTYQRIDRDGTFHTDWE